MSRLAHTEQRAMSTLSASSIALAASSVSRRSKRLSYADADKVYGEKATTAPSWSLLQGPHTESSSTAVFTRGTTTYHASLRTRAQQRWLTLLLRLMRTPYVGALAMRVLEAAAYAAYVKGSVMLFTRRRVGPPVATATGPNSSCEIDMCKAHCKGDLSMVGTFSASSSLSPAGRPSAAASSSLPFSHGAPLREHALDCLYIGNSPIHSRGLFTARALPRGTRIIAEPRRSLLLAPHFATLLADTHEKLPDTWHYTQPTGCIVELVTQAQPHHLMNHSCAANVCSGLSHTFWEAATIAGKWQQQRLSRSSSTAGGGNERTEVPHSNAKGGGIRSDTENRSSLSSPSSFVTQSHSADWRERLTLWSHFADANSFFVTRDIAAGEELTLDYSTRMAPLYAGELARALQSRSWLLCRCGQPFCRHYVYRPTPEVISFLRALHTGRCGQERSAQPPGQQSAPRMPDCAAPPSTMDVCDPLHVMAKLLELGFDDELVLLSYAASSADVVAYLYGQPLPSLQRPSLTQPRASFARRSLSSASALSAVQEGIDVEVRRVSKRQLLAEYRYVFRILNEAVPVRT
ncbi:hypothetical protein MNV84_01577 [Leishmania braziliensis]|nr:hypothetical protein MNV84_01577 [Leishmania braziliensis]